MALLLRFILQYLRADFYNPISQAVIQVTSKPFLRPLRKVIPGFYGLDLAIVFLVFTTLMVQIILLSLITSHNMPNILGMVVWIFGSFIGNILTLYFWCIVINAIMSFVPNLQFSPVHNVFYSITNPILKPIRNKVPIMSGFDISPFLACVIITLLQILISQPIVNYAYYLI
tara:strand:- start:3644 stop:4159 length:516 start_codon:yes stop_codon:yes gene_type:complete